MLNERKLFKNGLFLALLCINYQTATVGRATLQMYSHAVTNYFIKNVLSNIIQVLTYESNVI